jgi:hypothetical protein
MSDFSYSGTGFGPRTGLGGFFGRGINFNSSNDPMRDMEFQRSQFGFQQEQAMAPYQLSSQMIANRAGELGLRRGELDLQKSQFGLQQEKAMAPYQLSSQMIANRAGELGLRRGESDLQRSQFGFKQEQAMAPYQLGMAKSGAEQAGFDLYRSKEMFPLEKQQAEIGVQRSGLGLKEAELGLQRGRAEFGEFQAGAGLRGMQRQIGEAESSIGLARIGNVAAAGQRAYTMGREEEELSRLRMAGEGRRIQSQMAFQPQMDAIRGSIIGKMARRLGTNLPQMGGSYSSGTDYKPSWMQNNQAPQFPRY